MSTTLKEAASHFRIDYQYFRDKFIRKVLGIYAGLPLEKPLKDPQTRGLTEFGMEEVENYIKFVKDGEMSHDAYREQVRERILKAAAAPSVVVVVEEPNEKPQSDEVGLVLLQEEVSLATPLLNITIENLQITLPQTDTTEIDIQTEALTGNTGQLVNALATYVAKDLTGKMKTVLAQNTNLAAGVQNAAVQKTVKDLGVGKAVSGGS